MGKLNLKICREGVDFARGFAFLLQTRREADPGPTQNMYRLMLRSATYGGMVLYEDEACGVVGAACYSIGSERADFEDCDVVQVDYILLKPELQGTFYFLRCMRDFFGYISEQYPDVTRVTMEAEASSLRNNRLYSKFARLTGTVQGDLDVLHVYQAKLAHVSAYVRKLLDRNKREDSE